MDLIKTVQTFLKQNVSSKKKLLLGFSGGTDSLALADCFLRLSIDFDVAHFNHGWRETSGEEAEKLKNWAYSQGLFFHTTKSVEGKKNEQIAREERFLFFEKVFSLGDYEALVLAHQQQDQVETVLKRVLEGARLMHLKGMQAVSQKGKIPIWRPLLSVPKEKILSYLKEERLFPIEDPTNLDRKYLRARMRASILPNLSKEFGKEVTSPLEQLGMQAKRLSEYLDQQTASYVPMIGPFGKMWDFKDAHPIEIEHVLCRQFSLTRPLIHQLTAAIKKGAANHKVPLKKDFLIVDRQKLFFLERTLPEFSLEIPLEKRIFCDGHWQWEIKIEEKESAFGWPAWWQGKISLSLPSQIREGHFLTPAASHFRKKRTHHKVPAFLRKTLPILSFQGKPIADFFTPTLEKTPSIPSLFVTIVINSRR